MELVHDDTKDDSPFSSGKDESTTTTTVDQCITIGGDDNGSSCVFPFTFDGVVYDKCTTVADPEGKFWCSTLTDEEGEHLKGNWGYCPSSSSCGTLEAKKLKGSAKKQKGQCITIEGADKGSICAFPFTFNGDVYDKCTTVGNPKGKSWCSTLTDTEGEHITGYWGYCPSSSSCGTLEAKKLKGSAKKKKGILSFLFFLWVVGAI